MDLRKFCEIVKTRSNLKEFMIYCTLRNYTHAQMRRKEGDVVLKIAISDDEKEFRDSAERMLKLYMEEKAVPYQADVFNVPSELVDMTEKGTIYDIYLLDIYMPGVTGMSIATELRNRDIKSPIIFLTSSTDHALEAFGVDATHYLLKPYT